MHRLMFVSSNIVASILLGAIALVLFALSFPNQFATMLDVAGSVKNWMTNLGIPPYYNNIIRLILHESTIVFSFFTIAARILVAALAALARWVMRDPNAADACPACGAGAVHQIRRPTITAAVDAYSQAPTPQMRDRLRP